LDQLQLGALGSGELLIVVFLVGMVLLLSLLVALGAALFFVWGPLWLEQQHWRWHSESPSAGGDRGSE
jgi:hypothetical protein